MISGLEFSKIANYNLCPRYNINNNIKSGEIVFVNLDYFNDFVNLLEKLKPNNIQVITHNSDQTFTKEHFNRIEKYISKIYPINCIFNNKKICKIPIGFPDKRFDLDKINNLNKTILAYMNFTIHTNKQKRTECYNILNNKSFITSESNIPQEQFYTQIARSKYVISPEGTGIDCHRIYESIYLDAIPIVKTSPLDDLYKKFGCIMIINNWEDITEEFLLENYDFYKNKINKKLLYPKYYIQKKFICFSLWGGHEFYNIGAYENAIIAKELYPDWICRFYYKDINPKILELLKELNNVELVEMTVDDNLSNTLWRFIPAFEDNICIFRDTDSRLNTRDLNTVTEWLESPYDIHIIRDHQYHGTEILAGMWGTRNNLLKDCKTCFDNYARDNIFDQDQRFLRSCIYPLFKDKALIHASACKWEQNTKDIINTDYNSFIGSYCVCAPNYFKRVGEPNRLLDVPDRLKDTLKNRLDLFYFY